jgi:hypothetical protein
MPTGHNERETGMRLRILGAAVAATAAVVIAPATTPAQAAPAAASGRHCVVDMATPTAMSCFDSLAAALSRATGGQVSAAKALTGSAADLDATVDAANASNAGKQSLNRAAVAGSIVIGIEYTGNNYSGSSLVISGSHTCDHPVSPREFWLNTLPSGWNDDIESFKAYAGCAAMHYLDIYMGGPREGWYTSWGGLGAVEDEVSSIEWS